MQIPEFIACKIESAFEELTEKLADELAKEQGEDMPAGALAFEMMSAEMFLQNQWRKYCKQKAAEHRVHPTAAGVPASADNSESGGG
jgi:hypothetical protein